MQPSVKMLGMALGLLTIVGMERVAGSEVEFTPRAEEKKIEVKIGGQEFTTFCYGDEFRDKPIFFPVLSQDGRMVNRRYPMIDGIEGENRDHPHHQSLYFTYGEVNGVDYWNAQKSGRRIKTDRVSITGDTLGIALDWIDPEGVKVLKERKVVTFGANGDVRWMDHAITLTANEVDVHFGDSKEGAFGIRLAGSLREKDRTGHYLNAEGLESSARVWGQPSAWVALTGTLELSPRGQPTSDGEDVTVAIFAHPSTYHFPPYWHARDYGLFAANPFGRKGYQKDLDPIDTHLSKGESLNLIFRLAVYEGKVGKDRLDADYQAFVEKNNPK